MFSIPRVNVIESDEGFAVEVLDRGTFLYTEGARSYWIDVEMLVGDRPFVVYGKTVRRGREWGAERIDGAERDRIVENIRRAFRFRGFELDVT